MHFLLCCPIGSSHTPHPDPIFSPEPTPDRFHPPWSASLWCYLELLHYGIQTANIHYLPVSVSQGSGSSLDKSSDSGSLTKATVQVLCQGLSWGCSENVVGAVVSSEGSTNRGNASTFTPERQSSSQSSRVVGQQPPLLPCHVAVSTGQLTMHRVLHHSASHYPVTSALSTSAFTHSATLPFFVLQAH